MNGEAVLDSRYSALFNASHNLLYFTTSLQSLLQFKFSNIAQKNQQYHPLKPIIGHSQGIGK